VNILTVNHDLTEIGFRPDSTLIRTMPKYFIPDYVSRLYAVPALCLKYSRAGKAVQHKFAGRYFDSFTFGILLHPEFAPDADCTVAALSVAMDYTSLISNNFLPIMALDEISADFLVNGEKTGNELTMPSVDVLREIVVKITRYTASRTGDIVAVELSPKTEVFKNDYVRLATSGSIEINLTVR